MGEYKPPFTITNEILLYVSLISEKIGKITATSSLESKPHLRKNNRIKSIHSSLKQLKLKLDTAEDVIALRLIGLEDTFHSIFDEDGQPIFQYKDLDSAQKQTILRVLVNKIFVHQNGDVNIEWKD